MTITDLLNQYTPKLFALAYRMTGETAVSEDIVQEALADWTTLPAQHVRNPQAYLAKTVVNRCLNHIAARKRQREAYKGPWLPEPIIGPAYQQVDASIDVSYGLLVLLQKLTPPERAVFLLREGFDLDYAELAGLLVMTPANCRQLYHRANRNVLAFKARFLPNPEHHQRLTDAFVVASQTGNLDGLLDLLRNDITLYSDGGGRVSAALHPLTRAARVGLFLGGIVKKYLPSLTLQAQLINGDEGLLFVDKASHQLHSVMTGDWIDNRISSLYIIRNPDKLPNLKGGYQLNAGLVTHPLAGQAIR